MARVADPVTGAGSTWSPPKIVWSLKKKVEKLQYMHMNPMKRGLVAHPKDWSWSSFSFYSEFKQGLIHIDPVN